MPEAARRPLSVVEGDHLMVVGCWHALQRHRGRRDEGRRTNGALGLGEAKNVAADGSITPQGLVAVECRPRGAIASRLPWSR